MLWALGVSLLVHGVGAAVMLSSLESRPADHAPLVHFRLASPPDPIAQPAAEAPLAQQPPVFDLAPEPSRQPPPRRLGLRPRRHASSSQFAVLGSPLPTRHREPLLRFPAHTPAPTRRRTEARRPTSEVHVVLRDAGFVAAKALGPDVNPPPAYPALARRRGWQGEALLAIEVRVDGTVGEVNLLRSSGHESLDAAALRAARSWTYVPALRGGQPEASVYRQPIVFRLDG